MSFEEEIHLAHTVRDTTSEGPGRRYAVWVQGCSLACAGCCNPHMFSFSKSKGKIIKVEELLHDVVQTAKAIPIEGVSLLGGEPFQQPHASALFCEGLQQLGLSVMVFTGYTLHELHLMEAKNPAIARLLQTIDLLVDGRYEEAHPEKLRRWIGSTNQKMHFLSSRYEVNDPQFYTSNTIEFRLSSRELQINGWPTPLLKRSRGMQ